jgi:hypothetical protein
MGKRNWFITRNVSNRANRGRLICGSFYTEGMFFRRERVKVPTFAERVDLLRGANFSTQSMPDGRVRITKHGVAAIIGDEGKNQPSIEKAGILVGDEIGILLNGGYQMFLELPNGKRLPATARELRALHEFEEDVKEALGLESLYNTSLGTTSRKHMYDRVQGRDQRKPRPWDAHANAAKRPVGDVPPQLHRADEA